MSDTSSLEDQTEPKITFKNRMLKTLSPIGRFFVTVGSKSWKGASEGALMATLIFSILLGVAIRTGFGMIVDILIILVLSFLLFQLIKLIAKFLFKISKHFPVEFVGSIIAALFFMFIIPYYELGRIFIIIEIIMGAIIGYAIFNGPKKLSSIMLVLFVLGANIFIVLSVFGTGDNSNLAKPKNFYKEDVPQLTVKDPSKSGIYNVKTLFYGSGSDKQRSEYGNLVSLKTQTIDVTPFFAETTGISNNIRKWFWGFNSRNFPINARVWYPDGEGQFPLVLIVHGNHQMNDFSDPGYEYLGRLLASRGFIIASVDENFLNGGWVDDYNQSENFTRAVILLKHLENWRNWNEKSGNPFYKKVDMNNIALIGHSRGGTAVAIASVINKLPKYYSDAKIPFNFNFSIKSIIQIAPNDPYQPTNGKPLDLSNINYLVLQGGYDSDMFYFMGNRYYNRLKFTGDKYYFKSALYIYSANHGQFNTVWGRADFGIPKSMTLNMKPIIDGEKQRRVAEVYISAFLEATLNHKKDYISMFKDYRTIKDLLPADFYINQFEDSKFKYIANYEEDLDVTTTSVPGCRIEAENLNVWSENSIALKDDFGTSQHNNGVYLGWDTKDSLYANKIPRYSIILTDSIVKEWTLSEESNLFFFLCGNTNNPDDSLDLSIELSLKNNITIKIPLSKFGNITPPLPTQLSKWPGIFKIGSKNQFERVLQYFEIPLREYKIANKDFDPTILSKISFVFDRVPVGEIILDKIGFD